MSTWAASTWHAETEEQTERSAQRINKGTARNSLVIYLINSRSSFDINDKKNQKQNMIFLCQIIARAVYYLVAFIFSLVLSSSNIKVSLMCFGDVIESIDSETGLNPRKHYFTFRLYVVCVE